MVPSMKTASLPFDLALMTKGRDGIGASMLVISPIITTIALKGAAAVIDKSNHMNGD